MTLIVVKPDDQTYNARDNRCQVGPSDHKKAIATRRVRCTVEAGNFVINFTSFVEIIPVHPTYFILV